MIEKKNQQNEWFAIRVTYSRERKLKEFLDTQSIENFLPMQYKIIKKGRKEVRELVPVIHNLIFIRSARSILDKMKKEIEGRLPMRYMMDKVTRSPIIVPEGQMQSFIAVAGTLDEQLLYLDDNINSVLYKGDKVRVTGGVFSGVEGVILRINRDRRVVVSIRGVIAVATAYILPSLIRKIE